MAYDHSDDYDCGFCFSRFYYHVCSKSFSFRRPVSLLWGKQVVNFRQEKQRRFRVSKGISPERELGLGWLLNDLLRCSPYVRIANPIWRRKMVLVQRESCWCLIVRTLRNNDGNSNENVAWKYKFALLQLLRDYSNLFNLYNVVELSSNRTGGNSVHVEKENENFTVICSLSPQNLEFGHFTSFFGQGRWRNVQKFVTHVQGLCFPLKSYCFLALSLPSPW